MIHSFLHGCSFCSVYQEILNIFLTADLLSIRNEMATSNVELTYFAQLPPEQENDDASTSNIFTGFFGKFFKSSSGTVLEEDNGSEAAGIASSSAVIGLEKDQEDVTVSPEGDFLF